MWGGASVERTHVMEQRTRPEHEQREMLEPKRGKQLGIESCGPDKVLVVPVTARGMTSPRTGTGDKTGQAGQLSSRALQSPAPDSGTEPLATKHSELGLYRFD